MRFAALSVLGLCTGMSLLAVAARPCNAAATAAASQARADSTLIARANSAARSTRATAEDSLAAERMAWQAIRGGNFSTGTKAARERRLLNGNITLSDALKITPGNEWMNAMRLRRPPPGSPPVTSPESRALCGASSWWCEMLYMFAVHRAGAAWLADSILGAALVQMPPHVRCVWGDVSPLIADGGERRRYERMTCSDRAEFEERFWWVSDPLHSTPGNERRVEHYAREVNMRLSNEGAFTGGAVPGFAWSLKVMRRATHLMHASDLLTEKGNEELEPDSRTTRRFDGFIDRAHQSLSYGNPLADRGEVSLWERMLITLRHRHIAGAPRGAPPATHPFVPHTDAVANPLRSQPSHWQLDASWRHESAYSPIGSIVPIDHQHAYLHRDSAVRLVVATDISTNPFLAGTLSRAALALSRASFDPPGVLWLQGGPRYVFSPVLLPDSLLVSVEIFAAARGGGRTRFGAAPPPLSGGRVDISDIVLVDPDVAAASSSIAVDSVLPRMFTTTRLAEKSAVGLFWELYGLNTGERPEISVSAAREPSGGLLGGLFGGSRPPADIRLIYTDIPASGAEIEGRVLAVDLSSLRPGRYVIEIRASVPGAATAVANRAVEIVRR